MNISYGADGQVIVTDWPMLSLFQGAKWDVFAVEQIERVYDSEIFTIDAEGAFEFEFGENAAGPQFGPFFMASPLAQFRLPWDPLRFNLIELYAKAYDVYRDPGHLITGEDINAVTAWTPQGVVNPPIFQLHNIYVPVYTPEWGPFPNGMDIITLVKDPNGVRDAIRVQWAGGNFVSGIAGRETWLNLELKGFSGEAHHLATPKGTNWLRYTGVNDRWHVYWNGAHVGELPLGDGEVTITPSQPTTSPLVPILLGLGAITLILSLATKKPLFLLAPGPP